MTWLPMNYYMKNIAKNICYICMLVDIDLTNGPVVENITFTLDLSGIVSSAIRMGSLVVGIIRISDVT
jgi:hypothetical protein